MVLLTDLQEKAFSSHNFDCAVFFKFEDFSFSSISAIAIHGRLKIICVFSASDNCETLSSEIHIMKDEYDDNKKLLRTCSGDILVSKCEGYCSSQVQPSIMSSTGFSKECFCCKEKYLKERRILLNDCYDVKGNRLLDEKNAIMEIVINEPAGCDCFKCGFF